MKKPREMYRRDLAPAAKRPDTPNQILEDRRWKPAGRDLPGIPEQVCVM